jgi:hypothetical protein
VTERILIILLLNFLFYLKALGYKYASDDIAVQRLQKIPDNKWLKLYHQLEGRIRVDPLQDHAITIFIHSLVAVFLYIGFGASDISFLASILFSINPATNQCSVWISGRGYVLPALFILMGLSIPVVGPLFVVLAGYFNLGFIAPLALIGSDKPYLLLALPVMWVLFYKRFFGNVKDKYLKESFAEDKQIKPEKFVLAIKTFGFYLTHALIPVKNTFYHSFLESAAGSKKHLAYSMKCRFFWIGVVSILSIIGFWISFKWNIASFGLLWWCVGIAPFCNFFRLSQEIAERYMYLASIGLMVALASVLVNYPIVSAFFMGMYATKMWFWMDAYQDDFYLVEASRVNDPTSWFVWHISGLKRWDVQSYREAIIMWTMAKILSPKEFKVLINLATALKVVKHDKEAEELLNEAEKNIPGGQEEQANKLIKEWREGKIGIIV